VGGADSAERDEIFLIRASSVGERGVSERCEGATPRLKSASPPVTLPALEYALTPTLVMGLGSGLKFILAPLEVRRCREFEDDDAARMLGRYR
jgi:hypothetical protein